MEDQYHDCPCFTAVDVEEEGKENERKKIEEKNGKNNKGEKRKGSFEKCYTFIVVDVVVLVFLWSLVVIVIIERKT